MLVEQTGHLLVQLADLLLEELQLLQHHLQQPAVHGLEVRARAQRITQLFRRGAQLPAPPSLLGARSRHCYEINIALSIP
jgi:hypothetical protein